MTTTSRRAGRPARSARAHASRLSRAMALLVATVVALATLTVAAPARATTPITPTAPAAAAPTGHYVAVARQGGRDYLRVVSRATGKVMRTVGSVPLADPRWGDSGVLDADLAPDGAVYAVVVDTRLPSSYQTRLRRYDRRGATDLTPYVTSVRVSPDGRQVAVAVLSPDGDHDGKGLAALRVLTPSGAVRATLASTRFPVGRDGAPTVEIGGLSVQAWVGSYSLVVHDGCCDDGTASIVSATRRSPYGWPGLNGSWDTRAIGVKRGSVLAARPRWAGDGVTVPLHVVGVEAYWLVAGKDGGRYAGYVAKEDADVAWAAPLLNRRAGATALEATPAQVPYRGSGRLVAVYL